MLPTRVALLPFTDKPGLSLTELLRVAAALQTQVTRDVAPIWAVEGVVSPFESFDDVPPGYIPLAIVDKDRLPDREHAFHFAPGGQPLGIVGFQEDWSVLASHELIEIMCDPWGNRTTTGTSLRDDQGQVEYLVEVCDPCQEKTYTINDVAVSDFVTPRYYDPVNVGSGPYSCMENVTEPLEVLDGGYITWCVRGPEQQEIWQAKRKGKELCIAPLTTGTPMFTRMWVDRQTGPNSAGTAAPAAASPPVSGASGYGAALKAEVEGVLDSLAGSPPSFDDLLKFIDDLANDPDVYGQFKSGATRDALLKDRGLNPNDFKFSDPEIPSQGRYKKVYASLNSLKTQGLGPGLDQPSVSSELQALAMHGST
jgi:hypothetical protein